MIELKTNQRSLRYGLEDSIKTATPTDVYKEGPERLSQITKQHWDLESMHRDLDRNLRQDSIKRKTERAARNLDTIQRMVLALMAV